jgi:hypothetical protein
VTSVDLLEVVMSPAMIALVVWIYRHCTRPALAMDGAPPIAFDLVLGCLFGMIAVLSILLIDAFVEVPRGLTRFLSTASLLLFVPLALGFFRPSWFTRVGAGRDGTAPVRFLLTWMGAEWTKLAVIERSGPDLIRVVERELERIREPSNATLVDEWVVILETYLRKSAIGQTSGREARRVLVERLNQVRPVDRLVRIF